MNQSKPDSTMFYVWCAETCDNASPNLEESKKWADEFAADGLDAYVVNLDNVIVYSADACDSPWSQLLAAQALVTQGPVRRDGHCVVEEGENGLVVLADCDDEKKSSEQADHDAQFIALAHRLMPLLIQAVRVARSSNSSGAKALLTQLDAK